MGQAASTPGPIRDVLSALAGLFQSQPDGLKHEDKIREALILDHKAAIEDARKQADAAKTEADRLLAEMRLIHNQRALELEMRKPVMAAELIEEARVNLGIDSTRDWNVVFCGETGTGKSFTIGAIFEYAVNSPGAPPVSVTECTRELTKYISPSYPNLALWDAPGCGTDSFPFYHPTDPKLNYYRRFGVFAFHLVVLFSADRLSQGAVQLARLCFESNQPVIIVRNKADRMVEDMVDNGEATDMEDAKRMALGKFEEDLVRNLGPELATRIPHYLISMRQYRRHRYDFGEIAFVHAMAAAANGHVRARTDNVEVNAAMNHVHVGGQPEASTLL